MHVLLGLLVVALAAYFIHRSLSAPSTQVNTVSATRSERAFAFLSNGTIFYRERGDDVKQLHSPYAQDAIDRRERSRSRHSWKEGTAFNVAAGGGHRSFEGVNKPLVATAAAYEPGGGLLYFLEDEHVGGLFRREAQSGNELRVVLKPKLHLTDLSPSPDGALLAASSRQSDGIANIVLMNSDGSDYREVTGGDTVDSSPAWIPGETGRMLFQSSGFARNEEGYILAQGNTSIQMLDMESGVVKPILEDATVDYLKPRVAPSGDLLFIRRPFEGPRYGIGTALGDIILFPFRLVRAVFHYLNFFSLMYSRKPLTSADSPATQADIKSILLLGRRVDIEKGLRSARPVQGVPSLVPDTWQLVARDQRGNERMLATNVASYDISPDGTVIYSNGRGVFVVSPDGSSSLAITDQLVGEVVAATV
jgi:hypothetical protein